MFELLFKPWIGDRYGEQSPRLLLLGESHYGEGADQADATIKLTRQFVEGDMNHRFWTSTMKIVEGPDCPMDRGEFWNGVAFYNYVQQSVGANAGDRPTPKQFRDSEAAFFQVLDDVKPDAILVLGTELWDKMPNEGERSKPGRPLVVAEEEHKSWIYTYEGGQALTTWVPHPSRHFSWHSHEVAKALLAASSGK